MTLPEFATLAKDVGFSVLVLFMFWQYMRQAGGENQRSDDLVNTLVGNITQVLASIRDKLENDTQFRIQDRKVLTSIDDSGGKTVELLTGVREDLRGVAVLGGKIEALQDMVRGMKTSVELLITAAASGSEDHDSIQDTLERVSSQLGVLIEEGRESHTELLHAIHALQGPNPTPPPTEPASAPNVTPMPLPPADAGTHDAVKLPERTEGAA